jgi:hypothetical protein
MARKLTSEENQTHIMYDLEYGKKTAKHGKLDTHIVGT